ncbi:hypothetical protein ACFSKL_14490 [Belliella marina]|uniref:DoxX family protein n=1 Tax=Belliella marina TaxID=1644146 RepID=A0ABW4VR01_9BACT
MNELNRQLSLGLKTFLGLYVLIYCFPFPADYIPYTYEYFSKYIGFAKANLNLYVGKYLLGFQELNHIEINGSGDTTLDYISLLSYSLLAVLITIILLIFSKNKEKLVGFYAKMLIYARYFVGLTLISYGVIKFLHGQFPSPSLMALEATYGESSPMGLAWRFFGYSDLYKGFMGFSEVLAGFLLLFRRTAILGALVSIAVCTNIFFVNLSFDVPVKLFSGHLLFFSVLIALPRLKTLVSFFFLHEEVSLKPIEYDLTKKRKKWSYIVLKVVLVGLIPLSLIIGHVSSQSYRTYLNEWEGVYEVISFGIEDKPDVAETAHWDKIIIQGKTIMTLNKSKSKKYYTIENIWNEGEINFIENHEQEDPYSFYISELEDGSYKMETKIGNNQYLVNAKRKVKTDYLLINRGFRWVNETPYNR